MAVEFPVERRIAHLDGVPDVIAMLHVDLVTFANSYWNQSIINYKAGSGKSERNPS